MSDVGLVDCHIHLTDFPAGTDLRRLVDEAAGAGVTRMICNGTSEKDWPTVLEVAKNDSSVIPCFGLHPWFVAERSHDWARVLEGFIESNTCGVGEMGLDRLTKPFGDNEQEHVFRVQLELARKYGRPAMVHCVRAWGRLVDILSSMPPLPKGFLVHAYGGSVGMIGPLARLGAYFSFSGKVLDPRYGRARAAIVAVPPDRLLLETDAPNMVPPEEYQVKSLSEPELNHPANLAAILEGVAELLGETPDSLREKVWENSERFLGSLMP